MRKSYNGSLEAFDVCSGIDGWENWIERLEFFAEANNVRMARLRSLLFVFCGPALYKLVKKAVAPEKLDTKSFDELIEVVRTRFDPIPGVYPAQADSDVGAQKLREWRRQGANVSLIDLNKAHLQIRIDESLWPYQTVVFKRRRYCLTRLGFGLNVAPLIMKAVVKWVLSQDLTVEKGTSACIDDILVDEDVVGPTRWNNTLCVMACHARLMSASLTELEFWASGFGANTAGVFSYCGKLVGHLPVCGWLRVATAFAKRKANDDTASWDEVIDDNELRTLLLEIAAEVKVRDPARGTWDVSGNEATVWVDASSLAVAAAFEVGGSIVEDAA
ncbi:hypothetical protein TTRE_0000618001 [Trichuris trichiura]|uniref:DUF7047 domain-containing protein n=1 Tax=Trichuris trichiura TaxID=36087 RepID=A0A077ZBU8_TRITR|nr:hypothetical protein TTRE_0000618001 [Trichuris trichiura]